MHQHKLTFFTFLWYDIDKEWHELQELEGRLGGLRDHGESISLTLVTLKDAYKAAPDAKLLSSLALFNALKAEGKL